MILNMPGKCIPSWTKHHCLSSTGVAAYVGWQSSSILKPLLQQGLSDVEEFVIYKALNALTCMCQLGLLQKTHIYEFVSDIGEGYGYINVYTGDTWNCNVIYLFN